MNIQVFFLIIIQLLRTMQSDYYKVSMPSILFHSKIRRYLNPSIALQLYKTLLLPTLEYGDLFIISTLDKTLGKLQKFQNRILHLVYNIHSRETNVELHCNARILPLAFRRYFAICRTIFNLSFQRNRLKQSRPLPTSSSALPTLSLPFPRSISFISLFFPRLSNIIWYNLPNHLRMIRDYKLFLKNLNLH